MQDGVAENFTAGDARALPRRLRLRDRQRRPQLRRPGRAARATSPRSTPRGFQVHFHALGDRAVREALDAVEARPCRQRAAATTATTSRTCRSCTPTTSRASPQLGARRQHPAAVGRARTADGRADHPVPRRATRSSWQYPFGDLLRAGARLAAGSDWSVSSPDPLAGIHVAVNRVAPGRGRRRAALPAQPRSPSAEALTAYTAGSAYVNHHDERPAGSSVGRARRPRRARPRPLRRAAPSRSPTPRVVSTYVEGELVYSAS